MSSILMKLFEISEMERRMISVYLLTWLKGVKIRTIANLRMILVCSSPIWLIVETMVKNTTSTFR